MRNLKRALSLTLASVMLLGMMVVGAGAASFPDVDKDDNIEAIEVLAAVEVIVGDDGNFKPDDPVTRNEMAVIMAKLLNLDYDYYVSSCPFTDVADWAKGWVGACAANGIIAGRSATEFDGQATVTAVEAAAMMMRALGYFQYAVDYKDGFTTSTVKQASKINLFAGIDGNATTPMTRNQVAQLALNTLESTVVDPEDNTLSITGSNGDMSMSISGGQVNYIVRTSSQDFAKAIKDNKEQGGSISGTNGYTVELGEQLYNGDLKKDSSTDDFERPATRWTYKFSEIGTYADTPDYVYTTAASGDTPADKVKDMGLKGYKWDGVYYENGAAVNTGKIDAEALEELADEVTGTGVLVEVFMDSDRTDTIDTVTVIRTQMMQVNAVNSKEVTLKKLGDDKRDNGDDVTLGQHAGFITVKTVKEDDAGFDVLKDLKTDDYVLIVPVKDGSQYKVASAVVPEVVTGVLETINTKATDGKVKSIRVDGTTYNMSNTWTSENDEMHRGTVLTSKIDCQVYLDIYGNAIYVKDVQANNSAIIIDYIYNAVEDGKIVKYAEGWDSNGEGLTLNLGTSPNFFSISEADLQGKVFEYKISSVNGADYELIKPALSWDTNATNIVYQYSTDGDNVANSAASSTINYGDYSAKIAGWADGAANDTSLPFDSAVKFIFISTESGIGTDVTGITVKTGVSEVKPYTNSQGSPVNPTLTYILNGDRTKIIAVVVDDDNDAGNTTSLLYLEAITSHANNANGKRVAYATVWIDGEQFTNVELSTDYDGSAVNKFYTYAESNGIYTLTLYNKTGKTTSVTAGQVLTTTDLSKQDYWFQGLSNTLNAKDAKVFDLYSADGKFYDTVKGMQDAIKNGDVSEKTRTPITSFTVSYIYNGDAGDPGYNTVKYVFITASNEDYVPPVEPGPGEETPDPDTLYYSKVNAKAINASNLDLKDSDNAAISNGTISKLSVINGDTQTEVAAQMKLFLESEGYELSGNIARNSGGNGYEVTTVKDGLEQKVALADSAVTKWYPVTVNGGATPVAYIKSGTNADDIAVAKPTTNAGTGLLIGSTYEDYDSENKYDVTGADAAVDIKTGYVEAEVTSATTPLTTNFDVTYKVDGVEWDPSTVDGVKVGGVITIELKAKSAVTTTNSSSNLVIGCGNTAPKSIAAVLAAANDEVEFGAYNATAKSYTVEDGSDDLAQDDTITITYDAASTAKIEINITMTAAS